MSFCFWTVIIVVAVVFIAATGEITRAPTSELSPHPDDDDWGEKHGITIDNIQSDNQKR